MHDTSDRYLIVSIFCYLNNIKSCSYELNLDTNYLLPPLEKPKKARTQHFDRHLDDETREAAAIRMVNADITKSKDDNLQWEFEALADPGNNRFSSLDGKGDHRWYKSPVTGETVRRRYKTAREEKKSVTSPPSFY